jgi:uncharacterized protein
MSVTEFSVVGLPFPLSPDGAGLDSWRYADGAIEADALPRSDLFIDPADPRSNSTPGPAARLLGTPEGDFQLSARVTVDFHSMFDAGVLLVFADERNWAKLCFEYTPQQKPSVVTVVTRGWSDDANAFEIDANAVWLRISRTGSTFAFHASTDGHWWRMVRYFALGQSPDPSDQSPDHGPVRVGFQAQSPTGDGCRVTFDEIEFRPEAPLDLRDGS